MVFYDIGANVGLFTILAGRLVSPGGSVIAFEPQPENLSALRNNLDLNQLGSEIRVVEAAASGTTGPGTFNAETSMTGRVEEAGTVSIKLIRVDDFVADNPSLAPNLVKIDVEGHEMDVLAGMADTLRHSRPIAIIEGHRTRAKIESRLEAFNYRVTPLEEKPGRARHLLAAPG